MRRSHLHPPLTEVRDAVRRALAEDLAPLGDLSSSLLDPATTATAALVAREPGVLAGAACADETFVQVNPTIERDWLADDGDALAGGQTIANLSGALVSMLGAERTALNFLGHLSGIATAASRYVAATSGTARVWDTRKTTPGLRALQKAAVRAGGAHNHRGNLSDWIMLKDNHLAGRGIGDAVAIARGRWPGRVVHVECDRLEQVEEALAAGADALLLDNMSPDEIRSCIEVVDARIPPGGRRPLIEASGGITLETIGEYSSTGVDMISSGAITNSAGVLDIGLDIDPQKVH